MRKMRGLRTTSRNNEEPLVIPGQDSQRAIDRRRNRDHRRTRQAAQAGKRRDEADRDARNGHIAVESR